MAQLVHLGNGADLSLSLSLSLYIYIYIYIYRVMLNYHIFCHLTILLYYPLLQTVFAMQPPLRRPASPSLFGDGSGFKINSAPLLFWLFTPFCPTPFSLTHTLARTRARARMHASGHSLTRTHARTHAHRGTRRTHALSFALTRTHTHARTHARTLRKMMAAALRRRPPVAMALFVLTPAPFFGTYATRCVCNIV